jgi:hypothetical protein
MSSVVAAVQTCGICKTSQTMPFSKADLSCNAAIW